MLGFGWPLVGVPIGNVGPELGGSETAGEAVLGDACAEGVDRGDGVDVCVPGLHALNTAGTRTATPMSVA